MPVQYIRLERTSKVNMYPLTTPLNWQAAFSVTAADGRTLQQRLSRPPSQQAYSFSVVCYLWGWIMV